MPPNCGGIFVCGIVGGCTYLFINFFLSFTLPRTFRHNGQEFEDHKADI